MLKKIENGFVVGVKQVLSPNFNERPNDEKPTLLVIHNISLPPFQYGGPYVEQLFTGTLDPTVHPYFEMIYQLQVSSHFFIRRDGAMIQFVSCDERAWHAGQSNYQGRENCNDFSIGIELEGCDVDVFTDAQYQTLADITHLLYEYYPIQDIVGHSDIAPGRKTDPGPYFDWPRYHCLLKNGLLPNN